MENSIAVMIRCTEPENSEFFYYEGSGCEMLQL